MAQKAADKRRLDRVRTILAGQAIPGRGLPEIECQIRDLSESGARLSVDSKAFLPTHFQLRIPKRNKMHLAQMRWREGSVVGVEFVDQRADADPVARIRELEDENAELRRRIADMAERLFTYGDTERSIIS